MRIVGTIGLLLVLLAAIYGGVLWWYKDPAPEMSINREMLRKEPRGFGRGFLWGSSTSAYQVEGNCSASSWKEFESSWDEKGSPVVLGGCKAGTASDQWNRYRGDVQLMKSFGLNAYRFSIEWSRVEPRPGDFDEAALAHYDSLIDELRFNGIEPVVTLHHFSDPAWFMQKGGFLQENSPDIFARYAEKVVRRFAGRVKYWCTIDAPAVYAINGYLSGIFPPRAHDADSMVHVLYNMLRSHTAAYSIVRRARVDAQAGIGVDVLLADPASPWNPLDVMGAHWYTENFTGSVLHYLNEGDFLFHIPGIANTRLMGNTKQAYDFVGINYFTRRKIRYNPASQEPIIAVQPAAGDRTGDTGNEIYPEGIYRALEYVRSYTSKPVFITANGVPDSADVVRSAFITDHLAVLNHAIRQGMDVRGYFYSSFIDGFEWERGFSPKYGLYAVDFKTGERTLRPGAQAYADIIHRGFESGVK
jgi:beta-glucosidase